MKVVINIPKKMLDWLRNGFLDDYDGKYAISAILNGTPLPKGHGDLIDIEELKDMLYLEDNDYNRDNNVAELVTLEDLDRLDVIIEADKEEKDAIDN